MSHLYDITALTRQKVAFSSGYIDWATQPSLFKHYPEFLFSYAYGEKEQLHVVELARQITSDQIVAAKPYYKLNTPSAGNLHPLELYVQIRGIKGIISGIYHVDASAKKIVLLQEIESDGIERALNIAHKFKGMLFLLSYVPFRSEWKYGERAIRYCYLDAGHQIAALQASANVHDKKMTILSGYDVEMCNKFMGFKDEEFLATVISMGEESDKEAVPLFKPLLHVAPTDYNDSKGFVPKTIQKGGVFEKEIYPIDTTKELILKRRSARKFEDISMHLEDYDAILEILQNASELVNFGVVVKDGEKEPGIYLDAKMQNRGNHLNTLVALLLDQQFLKNAQMIIVMSAEEFSADKMILSGALAHKLYLEAEKRELAFTGIGAFYDEKLQNFLQTQNAILYVCAVGM